MSDYQTTLKPCLFELSALYEFYIDSKLWLWKYCMAEKETVDMQLKILHQIEKRILEPVNPDLFQAWIDLIRRSNDSINMESCRLYSLSNF